MYFARVQNLQVPIGNGLAELLSALFRRDENGSPFLT